MATSENFRNYLKTHGEAVSCKEKVKQNACGVEIVLQLTTVGVETGSQNQSQDPCFPRETQGFTHTQALQNKRKEKGPFEQRDPSPRSPLPAVKGHIGGDTLPNQQLCVRVQPSLGCLFDFSLSVVIFQLSHLEQD